MGTESRPIPKQVFAGSNPVTRFHSQNKGSWLRKWRPICKVNPFFGGSEYALWPFRFAPSGSANRSIPRRVPVSRQELDSLPQPGTCEPCQAPHTTAGSISWSRRPEITPIPRRTHFPCVASPHERVAAADREDRQLAYRAAGLRAGSLTDPGSTPRGEPYPNICPPGAATTASTYSSTPMCRDGVFD